MTLFYLGFMIIFIITFISSFLILKVDNLLYRTLGIILFFTINITVISYGANLSGLARTNEMQYITFEEELNKVRVLEYYLSPYDRKIIYLWIIRPNDPIPLYYVIENASQKTRKELTEKSQQAKKSGKMLIIYLKGKPDDDPDDSKKGDKNTSRGDEENYRVEIVEPSVRGGRSKTIPTPGLEIN